MISKIVDNSDKSTDKTVEEAIKMAKKIAQFSEPIIKMAKESELRSFNTPLEEGLNFEKRLFHSTFATNDRKEGMNAFSNKRTP